MNTCKNYQNEIQNHLDNNKPLSKDLQNHIRNCRDCRSFLDLFLSIKKNAKEEINNKLNDIKEFDFAFISAESEAKEYTEKAIYNRVTHEVKNSIRS